MDIQKEKFNELFDIWIEVAHKENIKNLGSLMANAMKPALVAMKEVNKNFFEEGVEFAQKQAIPDGYVLVPREPTKQQIGYVVDQMRLSGGLDMVEQIYKAMIEAQEPTHD